ncbi:MAG: radical SAM protein [Bacteroidales bacterium]|nr:radical SAM protein [Bacteroidales bacterium]
MFSEIIENYVQNDNAVPLWGQIQITRQFIGEDTPIIRDALSAAEKYGQEGWRLTKKGLLDLWKDEAYSFAAKCLATFWWGHPSHFVLRNVYSRDNLYKLRSSDMENAFFSLRETPDFSEFKTGLEELYRAFLPDGRFYLDRVGVSFFTKIFHFYFASHPPKSNPQYLPVIADDIMRSAVFAEMLDRGENVLDIFNPKDASLRSYVAYVDKFNDYADALKIGPFALEDIVFNMSRGIGKAYVSGYNSRIMLPHWVAGSYNEQSQAAIVFNNLAGETYLFEGPTAVLWNELLKYDYEQGFKIEEICQNCSCGRFDLLSFFNDLIDKKILVDQMLKTTELDRIKKSVNRTKRSFLRSVKGVGNFHSVFESVDNDYRNIVGSQGIPLAASIELTYACNEACVHCYNPNSPREGGIGTQKMKPIGEMTAEEYFPVLDDMKKMGVTKIVFTGGDPFMKKDLMKILRYAHKLKFAFSVYTNGQALYSNSKLYEELKGLYPQYIGLSIYSTVPEVHDSITRRKGSCEKTMEVARWCCNDAIGLQIKCPIMRANKDSYGHVFDFALSVNGMPQFDVNITSSVDGDCFASQILRLSEEQLQEVLKDHRIPLSIENSVGAIDRQPDMVFCGAGESSFNIQPDGTVSPCCAFPMNCGNVRDKGLEEIWRNSENLLKIRTLRYGDSDICGKEKFCKYCNRCPGQSFVEHGVPENHSEDNCFLARIRCELAYKQEVLHS